MPAQIEDMLVHLTVPDRLTPGFGSRLRPRVEAGRARDADAVAEIPAAPPIAHALL